MRERGDRKEDEERVREKGDMKEDEERVREKDDRKEDEERVREKDDRKEDEESGEGGGQGEGGRSRDGKKRQMTRGCVVCLHVLNHCVTLTFGSY